MYHFYPPFFVVDEENSFAEAWESFCCKLLNLSLKTDEIYRRHPPEQGIDLYHPSKRTAYQCKSVESGKSSDFNVDKVLASIQAARAAQPNVGWKEFVVCTNVEITGSSEARLRSELPQIILRPRSYWLKLCGEFSVEVERNFRRLLTIPPERIAATINHAFYPSYSNKLRDMLDRQRVEIFLYSNRNDKVYRVPVSLDFKVQDLVHVFKNFFRLPAPTTIKSEGISVSLSHALVFAGQRQDFSKSLNEVGIVAGDIVTYWTTMVWETQDARFDDDKTHMITLEMTEASTKWSAKQILRMTYIQEIREAFAIVDETLDKALSIEAVINSFS
jgi:hypothetical protein